MPTNRLEERVLIVDDEADIAAMCRRALETAGHDVVEAVDGVTALEELHRGSFAAAVLDIRLPDTNGLELLREIKQRDMSTVVVLITGSASLETAMQAVRLGAYDYLRKPFSAWELVRIVDRGLESRRLQTHNNQLLDELRHVNEELVRQQEHIRSRMRMAAEDLSAFVDLGRKIRDETSLGDMLQSIMTAGMQVTRARAAAIYRLRTEDRHLVGLLTVGLPSEDIEQVALPRDNSLLVDVARSRHDLIENDMLAGPIADDEHLGFLGVQSVLASPLLNDDRVLGTIAFFDHEEGAFPEESINLARLLAGQAASVVADMSEQPEQPRHEADAAFVDIVDMI